MALSNPQMSLMQAAQAAIPFHELQGVFSARAAEEVQKRYVGDAGGLAGLAYDIGAPEPAGNQTFGGVGTESMLSSAMAANGANNIRKELLNRLPG